MTAAALTAAEKRYATNTGIAASLVMDGTTYDARIVQKRGIKLEHEGGTEQQRTLTAVVLCAALPAAEVIDASSGDTRPRTFTCDGLTYRITPGGVQRSRLGIYWSLRAASPNAQ